MKFRTVAGVGAGVLLAALASAACGGEKSSPDRTGVAREESDQAAQLREALEGSDLEPFTEAFLEASLPAGVLTPDSSIDVSAVGLSRLGGRPDLPRGTEWPRSEGAPLTLVAQIDLAEVAQVVPESGLPTSGLLSFFFDHESEFSGMYPDTPDAWRVIHSPADSDLVTLPWPAQRDPDAHFEPVGLTFTRETTFPSYESAAYEAITELDDDAYGEATGSDDDEYRSQVGGHPDQVQGDVLDEIASDRVEAGGPASDARDWRLVLQLASFEDHGMVWDDEGVLYFALTADDLAAERWEKAWFTKQSH